MNGPVQCPYCERSFAEPNARYQHIKHKHPGEKQLRPPRDDEPSMASRLIDAQLDAAMGGSVPEHIEAMFPDEIKEARRRGREDRQ